MTAFPAQLQSYLAGILPVVIAGFLISGLIREFVPDRLVTGKLSGDGLKPILSAALLGTLLPVCCWGSLPIAVTLSRKGAGMGPVLAFLVATPATSVTSLMVTVRLLGPFFAAYEFTGVIILGLVLGAGGRIFFREDGPGTPPAPACCSAGERGPGARPGARWRNAFRFALVELPRDIGPEITAGIFLAALVASAAPVGRFVAGNLAGGAGYLFGMAFGLLMYVCATGTVPLVHALLGQGLNAGAGMLLLLFGPVTSYGVLLALRKRYGGRVLAWYLAGGAGVSLCLGYLFSLFQDVFR